MLRSCRLTRVAASAAAAAVTSNIAESSSHQRLLMRFAPRVECLATHSSCTLVNEQSFSYFSTLRKDIGALRDDFISTYRAEPTLANIASFQRELSQLLTSNETISGANAHECVLLLSLCYQTSTTPTPALLSRIEATVPQLISAVNGSPQYLLAAVCCYEFLAPHRLESLLSGAVPYVEANASSLRPGELFLLLCAFAKCSIAGSGHLLLPPASPSVFTDSIGSALLQRTLILANDFSAREVANISCAFAHFANRDNNDGSDTNEDLSTEVRRAIERELGGRFCAQQELATLRDASTMWWSLAVADIGSSNSEATRELHEACARRIFLLLRDMNAESFSKTVIGLQFASSAAAPSPDSGLAAPFKATRLFGDLKEVAGRVDFSSLHPVAALDAACAAAALGMSEDNTLFSRLTSRMLSGRSTILQTPETRDKLLHLASFIRS